MKIAVKGDEELKKAIAECVRTGARYVEIEIPGRPPSHVTPSANQPTQSAPASTHQPPAAQRQQQKPTGPSHPPQHQQQEAAPPPASGDSVLSFSIPGSGSGDKVKINAAPEGNRYVFSPTPCSHATRVEIQIASGGKALQFVMTSNVSKLTQTFNLPFEINRRDLSVDGSNVILNFPQ